MVRRGYGLAAHTSRAGTGLSGHGLGTQSARSGRLHRGTPSNAERGGRPAFSRPAAEAGKHALTIEHARVGRSLRRERKTIRSIARKLEVLALQQAPRHRPRMHTINRLLDRLAEISIAIPDSPTMPMSCPHRKAVRSFNSPLPPSGASMWAGIIWRLTRLPGACRTIGPRTPIAKIGVTSQCKLYQHSIILPPSYVECREGASMDLKAREGRPWSGDHRHRAGHAPSRTRMTERKERVGQSPALSSVLHPALIALVRLLARSAARSERGGIQADQSYLPYDKG